MDPTATARTGTATAVTLRSLQERRATALGVGVTTMRKPVGFAQFVSALQILDRHRLVLQQPA